MGVMTTITIDELPSQETEQVADVLARGMRDNPMHVVAFGSDPERREQRLYRLFSRMLSIMDLSVLVARDEDENVVGVLGMAAPGNCTWAVSTGQRLRMVPVMLPMGPGTTHRMTQWMGKWSSHDPADRHWHLGPVAVEPCLQGQGIGSQLLETFCEQMDEVGEMSHLETDKIENVHFYERFGFSIGGETDILGTRTWFMNRPNH